MIRPISTRFTPGSYRGVRDIDVIIIGAGHSGLAMSAQLAAQDIEHVVLEAGDIGQRWRHERWDSLKLLTPNWTLNLPGLMYDGNDSHGFMHKDEVAQYIQMYARAVSAPVKRDSRVHRVYPSGNGYVVRTTQGEWRCRAVVLATGAYADPVVPRLAEAIPADVEQITTRDYKRASDLPPGKVLVVGGSATGLQLAEEINDAGRDVILSVGEHVRMPRKVAGRDVYWWLMRSGVFWETAGEMDDIHRARKLPSPQLRGGSGDLTLESVAKKGVEIVGRFAGVRGRTAQFSGNLPNLCKSADLKLIRLLQRFNEMDHVNLQEPDLLIEPTVLPRSRLCAELGSGEVRTILWATGFKPNYEWLDVDTFDRKGGLRHTGGIVDAPGLYALGLPVMRTRASTFIAGAADDTLAVSQHIRGYLNNQAHTEYTAITAIA